MSKRAWIAIVAVAACSKSSDEPARAVERPASVSDQVVAIADRYVALMSKLADELAAAGTDCKKAAAAARARGAEAEGMRGDVEKVIALAKDPAATAWFDATYTPPMKAAGAKMRRVFEACRDDAELGAAVETNLLIPRKKKR
jgi:hypothetical protein